MQKDQASASFPNEWLRLKVQAFIALLGVVSLAIVLMFHNITDGDLWAKLAIGETVSKTGHVPTHEVYAFTPTLPVYVDHEIGAGVVFYNLVRWFGPGSLIVLRVVLMLGLLVAAAGAGWRQGCGVNVLLALAVPAAATILTGFIPVARSHVFTFFFFAVVLLCLGELWRGAKWAAVALPLLTLAGANLHAGFVVSLGVILFYCAAGWITRRNRALMCVTAVACLAVTLINPYGPRFWKYLIPALLNPRLRIAEFRPPPLLAWDDFWAFRLLFVLTLAAVALGWRRVERKNFPGLIVLAGTAFMTWHSRRHAPFFGIAALAFAGPYFQAMLEVPAQHLKIKPILVVALIYMAIAGFAAVKFLPGASLQPLAPVGEDPVREADILALTHAHGNLATPFAWGSYLSWRLYPEIKISMDGRYEAAYPESTFALNNAFYDHTGDWFRLCRDFKVDYVILDLQSEQLRPEDLIAHGYKLIWKQDTVSALLALPEHLPALLEAVRNLPPTTIDPLDLQTRSGRDHTLP